MDQIIAELEWVFSTITDASTYKEQRIVGRQKRAIEEAIEKLKSVIDPPEDTDSDDSPDIPEPTDLPTDLPINVREG